MEFAILMELAVARRIILVQIVHSVGCIMTLIFFQFVQAPLHVPIEEIVLIKEAIWNVVVSLASVDLHAKASVL